MVPYDQPEAALVRLLSSCSARMIKLMIVAGLDHALDNGCSFDPQRTRGTAAR
jgi:hypothetical protein